MSQSNPILLIEDDPAQRLLLAAYLRQAAFRVEEAESLAQGRTLAAATHPRLVLLDLNLPDGDGMELARELIRRAVPVLVVTSRPEDRLAALELGVDDFVEKPYDPRELLARIQNLLRRCGEPSLPTLPVGSFHLDAPGRRLLDGEGTEVELTRGEFDLLVALMEAKGRVLTRADLSEIISPEGSTVCSRSVDTLVSRLRRKLADDPRHPSLLQTVPGVGYRAPG
ncbi:MAG TPA: response regulator transcription factor [Geothrix sp.]|nr:response regulator transcription factor [Geothrix sp.]